MSYAPNALILPYSLQARAAHQLGQIDFEYRMRMAARETGERGLGPDAPILCPILLELAVHERTPLHETVSLLQQALLTTRRGSNAAATYASRLAARLALLHQAGVHPPGAIEQWIASLNEHKPVSTTI